MTDWELVDNPGWAGLRRPTTPFPGSECHDRSHFVTVQCACGEQMHMHETQWQQAHGMTIGAKCKGCGKLLFFEPGFFDQTLKEMRKRGWIA